MGITGNVDTIVECWVLGLTGLECWLSVLFRKFIFIQFITHNT